MRIVALLLAGLTLTATAAELPTLPGTVTRVLDGDTADVQLQSGLVRVRFHGIDAPEKNQPGGKEATAALSRLILGKPVQLEPFSQDRNQRLVATVYRDARNINLELVRAGHAWAYRQYLKRADAEFCTAEAAARSARKGLWQTKAIAPWQWRKRKTLASFTDYGATTADDCVRAIGKTSPAARALPTQNR